jgi:hypothetical protein
MTPGSMIRNLAGQNAAASRGVTGQGEPGLYTLLGGTGVEEDASAYRTAGGVGQTSSVARLARAHNDLRLAAVAAGLPPDPNVGRGTIKPPGPEPRQR